jgi:hypothetical protein
MKSGGGEQSESWLHHCAGGRSLSGGADVSSAAALKSYSVRPFRAGDEPGILRLFARTFGAAAAGQRDLAAWRWEFDSGPGGADIVVAVDQASGEIIAQYAALGVRFWLDGSVVRVSQPVDSMVDPAWRGSPVFLATARSYFARFGNAAHCFASYGFPNQRALRLGSHKLGYVPTFAPILALRANLFAPGAWQRAAGRSPPLAIAPVERFGAEVDALWSACRQGYGFLAVRDAAYLNWRYADAPQPYRCCVVRDPASGAVRAVFVLRERWCVKSILALVEYFGASDDVDAIDSALIYAVHVARSGGFGRVETWLSPQCMQFTRALAVGFEPEPSPFSMVARLYHGRPDVRELTRRWYFTIGDSDAY